MTRDPLFSVICATLLRPSYANLLASVRRQTFRDFDFIARGDVGPGVNEYVARNRAALQASGDYLVFVDDDAVLRPTHLARLAALLAENPDTVAVSGALEGNMLASGRMVLSEPGWWVGANLAVRRAEFLDRPFEESWGLPTTPRGWRADSDLGFWIESRYPGQHLHDHGLVIDHPDPMTSVWQPAVEDVFFRRWRALYLERFVPVDPRGQQFLLETQDLTPEETARVVDCRRAIRARIPGLPVLPQERNG